MFEIVKNVILSKSYKLEDMLNKINVLWLESKISDEEKNVAYFFIKRKRTCRK